MPCEKLLEFLDENEVTYDLNEHAKAFAARETAIKAGVPIRLFAKTVLVRLDGLMAMAVVPSDHKINFNLLRQAAEASTISLALENEFEERFPDCDLGAMPPFGNLYDMKVYLDSHLAVVDIITFNAGTHTETITMAFADFERLAMPQLAQFAFQPLMEHQAEM
ncbi:MAG: YbaK/EbsC family protein [Gemmatimonadales bacterium]|nr:YbaK/EbsC family protein [Gemmatimonadales bacterium]